MPRMHRVHSHTCTPGRVRPKPRAAAPHPLPIFSARLGEAAVLRCLPWLRLRHPIPPTCTAARTGAQVEVRHAALDLLPLWVVQVAVHHLRTPHTHEATHACSACRQPEHSRRALPRAAQLAPASSWKGRGEGPLAATYAPPLHLASHHPTPTFSAKVRGLFRRLRTTCSGRRRWQITTSAPAAAAVHWRRQGHTADL